jgi:hypothetical protein
MLVERQPRFSFDRFGTGISEVMFTVFYGFGHDGLSRRLIRFDPEGEENMSTSTIQVVSRVLVFLTSLAVVTPAFAHSRQANWSRVTALQPGTKVTVTVVGEPRIQREFVSADETAITLRMTPVIGRSELAPETIQRSRIVEIRATISVKKPALEGIVGGIGGFFGGALVGGIAGSLIGKAAGADPSNLGGVFWGTLGGGIAGSIIGGHSGTGSRVQEEVVYRNKELKQAAKASR